MSEDRFNAALRHARTSGDWGAVITLYMGAAAAEEGPQGAAFYLTHAYVHALEAGDARAADLKARLIALGADQPDP